MSNIKINGGLSYTIPVDSMDLNYLSKYVGSTSQMKPLWTKTRLNGEGGYCQVQILSQNEEECYSEPTETYECHICNVHVPLTCSVEHNKSEKHKTIKNIYQKVLEKLSKQIDMNIVEHDENIDKDTYYCVPCSKIIKKENKDTHESTEFHAKSNKDTIIISEFYKIINEDKSHNDDIILNVERLDEDSNFEPVNAKSCKVNNNNSAANEQINNNELAIPGPSNEGNKIQPPSDEKTETFDEYLKSMINKYKLKVNLPVIMLDKILIESNGDVVKVSPEHFQSYKHVKNSIYCQLCKMWISQETRAHELTENHVRNILKPINEKFARTIDNGSSHCVPCNVVVLTNSAHHTLDENHRKIVKDTRVQKQGQTFCEDCNLHIDTHNFAAHITSKKHIMIQNSIIPTDNPNLFFCKVCKLNVQKDGIKNHVVAKMHLIKKNNDDTKIVNNGATKINIKNTKSRKKRDGYKKYFNSTHDKKTVVCWMCNVKVPNLDRNIIEHVEGWNHGIADTELLEFHHMKKERSGYFCECCDENTEDELEHMETKSHTNTLLLNEEIDKKEIKKYVYEDNSNDLIPRCYRGLHKLLLNHNDIEKLNDTTYYCGICQIKMGRISELDHVLGERHALKLEEIQNP